MSCYLHVLLLLVLKKIMGFNFNYRYYALVGGAMGHTVVCSFVCLCLWPWIPYPLLAWECISEYSLWYLRSAAFQSWLTRDVDIQNLNKNWWQHNTTSAAISKYFKTRFIMTCNRNDDTLLHYRTEHVLTQGCAIMTIQYHSLNQLD